MSHSVLSQILNRYQQSPSSRRSTAEVIRPLLQVGSLLALITGAVFASPVLADPFRSSNAKAIDDKTEAAFKAIFEQGNYPQAQSQLQKASTNEPLAFALMTAMDYINQDWKSFEQNANRTLAVAENLAKTDPLRGNLYTAVGHFLQGAYAVSTEDAITGTPKALAKLKQVLQYLEAAEKVAPNDPEFNLIKGYMDLMIAVNLPFSDPNQAIQRLEKNAAPSYLVFRGIALAYRDLNQPDKALDYTERALQLTPKNPELHYLKGQLLNIQGQKNPALYAAAAPAFQTALQSSDQMPKSLVVQIFSEYCTNQIRVDNKARACNDLKDQIAKLPGVWGPKAKDLPKL